MSESNRTVFGYLSHPAQKHSEDDKFERGTIRCLFEEIDNRIYPINKHEFFDSPAYTFLFEGYEAILDRQLKRLFKLETQPNHNYEDSNSTHTRNVTNRRMVKDTTSTDKFFCIIKMDLPDPANCRVIDLPCFPNTQHFFIQEKDDLYGPFFAEVDATSRKDLLVNGVQDFPAVRCAVVPATNIKGANYRVKSNHIMHVKYQDLLRYLDSVSDACYLEAEGTFYFYDALRLANLDFEPLPYVTLTEVQHFLNALSNQRVIPKPTLTSLKMNINNRASGHPADLIKATNDFIDQIIQDAGLVDTVVGLFSHSPDGKKLIQEYVEQNKSDYIASWDVEAKKKNAAAAEQITAKQKELDELSKSITGHKQDLANIRAEIDRSTAKLSSDLHDEALGRAEAEAQVKMDQLNARLEELSERVNVFQSLSEAKAEEEKAIQTFETFKPLIAEREDKLAEIDRQTRCKEEELVDRIRYIIPTVSALMHAPTSNELPTPEFAVQEQVKHEPVSTIDEAIQITAKIINSVAREFSESYNRTYSNEFIASVLVANQQSMISILSGPPGAGKSSFVRILKDITQQGDRFLEVRVGRHWSSERDLIGFYNSLSDSFSPAPTGFYQYLKGVAKDQPENSTSHTILLDEANLSPIEHYGSNILSIADMESELSIRLAHERIRLPEDIRFIATVNFDMTTEPLSPRLLDRAPVIPFDSFLVQEAEWSDEQLDSVLSAQMIQKIFGKKSLLISETEQELPDVMTGIISVMESLEPELGAPVLVSRRKQASINAYYHVLKEVLVAGAALDLTVATKRACDFAVLYYLLPLINVYGETGRSRMELITNTLDKNGLLLSASKAKDILMRGKLNLDSYNFLHY